MPPWLRHLRLAEESMMSERPKAYEGKEKYIFISYAHSDRERVYEVLYELEKRGYRFWYDDGIAPGSEWAEDIAQHLNDAYVVIAFITKASVASDNCRREITYSLSKRKPFLSVILEETEMSAGLELQLSAQQSVIRQNFRNWDGFINKILLSPDIAQCKEEIPAAEPEPVEVKPAVVSEAVVSPEPAVPVTEAIAADIPAGGELIPDAAAEAEKAETAADIPKKKSKNKKIQPEKAADTKSKRPSKLIVLIAIATILVLASVMYSVLTTVKTSWGKDYSTRQDSYVTAENQTVTQEDIEKICKLQELDDIEFVGCDLSGCDLSVLTDQTKSKEGLRHITLDDCTGIKDYSFLGDAAWTTVSLKNQTGFTDLSLINMSEVSELNFSGTGVSDISALGDAGALEELDISSTQVSDISPLAGLPELTTVIARDTKVTSIDALSDVSELQGINFSGCSIGNIGRHFNTLKMKSINLAGCGIKDMGPFSDCTILTYLNLTNNPDLEDLSWLNNLNYPSLEALLFSGTGLDAEDLQFISSCPEIKTLTLDGIQTENLDFCKGAVKLEYLSAQGCGLKSISGLSFSEKLSNVYLGFNEITNIEGLTSLSPTYGTEIDLSCNKIESLSTLPKGNYQSLLIAGNKKDLVSSLNAEADVNMLVADWYDDITKAKISRSYSISDLYLIDTPADQKLIIEDAYSATVHYTSMDELYTQLLPDNELSNSLSGDYRNAARMYEARKSSASSEEASDE